MVGTGSGTRSGTGGSTNSTTGGGAKPRGNFKKRRTKVKEHSKRQAMLNTHRVTPFKYDLNEIMVSTQMDESKASSFTASVIAKATRISSKDAKDFVKTFVEEGDLTKEESDRICRLLDRYSKYR
ncbi:MAG: hypothetical protein WDA05_03875 [Candidatus Methanomethylophilaceae archaeon]|nr:hypothetical protein AOA81_00555 [Methanomassiliicoccales archaeon RumEn M2]MDD4119099.1 hypothetical protein [Candidatus Methanomethylophilaceae archaeon]MDD4454968.1 hypothetical protein [Candidatus Methanomethylophilaceae archaeon]MDI9378702.1 hypothetical protein [Candidatus Thermoplasmatota archaeon]